MAQPQVGLYLPASTIYRKIRTIKRTERCRLRPLTDIQAMPPAGWCSRCGAEVYRWEMTKCRRCSPREYG